MNSKDFQVYRGIAKPDRGENMSEDRVHFHRWHLASIMEWRDMAERGEIVRFGSAQSAEEISKAYLRNTQVTVDTITREIAKIESVIGPVAFPSHWGDRQG